MIDKVARVGLLYDIYGGLLTARQQNVVELYYFDDWSLSEVAETVNVSRQAVYDNLRRAEELLERYERELRVLAGKEETRNRVVAVRDAWSKAQPFVPEAVAAAVDSAMDELQQQVE